MDHIQNRPMDVRSIVGKENVNPLSNAQKLFLRVVSPFQQLRWHLLLKPTASTSTLNTTVLSAAPISVVAFLTVTPDLKLVRSTSRAALQC